MFETYPFDESLKVDDSVKSHFDRDGFIVVKNLLGSAEVSKLLDFFENDAETNSKVFNRQDGADRVATQSLWKYAGDDIPGTVPKMDKVVGTMEKLLGGHELYHYHSKLIMKNAGIGGQHVWHQDYGYWYQNGNLFPYMGAVFIALDKCTTQNSCLQVLKGSHLAGRIDHGLVANTKG